MAGDISRLGSRKRIRKEIGKFRRNIKQKLQCGFFEREGTTSKTFLMYLNIRHLLMVRELKGLEKLTYNSFPSSHESPRLEL